jgi:hypothetical protein
MMPKIIQISPEKKDIKKHVRMIYYVLSVTSEGVQIVVGVIIIY